MAQAATPKYVPVIDISFHQGATDFEVMKSRGIVGVILRAGNGAKNDKLFSTYYRDALDAGFAPTEIGTYWFLNPKADADGATQGARYAARVQEVTGSARNLMMLDIEDYSREGGSSPAVTGAKFRQWITRFDAAARAAAPESVVIAYSNASYWNPSVGGDASFAGKWEWIVPRYKVFSNNGYVKHPLPPNSAGWMKWAFALADGPIPPSGVQWVGWQFSAQFNAQGERFGCSSRDLDLNIVLADRWAAWQKQLGGGGTAPAVAGLRNSLTTSTRDPEGTTRVRPGEGFFQIAERIYGPDDKWKDLAMNAIATINGGIDRRLEPDDVLKLP